MILYKENPKESVKKLLELTSGFSKVAGAVNIKKTVEFAAMKLDGNTEKGSLQRGEDVRS